MSARAQKWVAVISKLNRMTQDGTLNWRPPDQVELQTNTLGTPFGAEIYVTEYLGKEFVIMSPRQPIGLLGYSTTGSVKIMLKNVGFQGGVLDEIDNVAGLDSLFDTVKFRSSGIDEYLDEVLKK